MEIFSQFGIEWKLLATQAVNFLLFLLIFWRFAYRPILKLLDDRQAKVAGSLKEAARARREAEKLDKQRAADLERAKREAAEIIRDAQQAAQAEGQAIVSDAKQASATLAKRQRQQLATDKRQLAAELRGELTALTVATTRKVLGDVVSDADRSKMVAAAVAELQKVGGRRGR